MLGQGSLRDTQGTAYMQDLALTSVRVQAVTGLAFKRQHSFLPMSNAAAPLNLLPLSAKPSSPCVLSGTLTSVHLQHPPVHQTINTNQSSTSRHPVLRTCLPSRTRN